MPGVATSSDNNLLAICTNATGKKDGALVRFIIMIEDRAGTGETS